MSLPKVPGVPARVPQRGERAGEALGPLRVQEAAVETGPQWVLRVAPAQGPQDLLPLALLPLRSVSGTCGCMAAD